MNNFSLIMVDACLNRFLSVLVYSIFMAVLRRCGHYIFILWFLMAALWNREAIIFLPCGFLLLLSFFFPRLISAVAQWMSTILRHMMAEVYHIVRTYGGGIAA